MSERRTLVLLSGGVDSALLLWRAARPVALFVDYGQPAARQEHKAARALADARGCQLIVQAATLFLGSMADGAGVPGPRIVPGRNLALIGHAVNAAGGMACSEVWIGAQGSDFDLYPDCRRTFVEPIHRACRLAYDIGVRAPLVSMSRREVMAECRGFGVPTEVCWSCYLPDGDKPCAACNGCRQG